MKQCSRGGYFFVFLIVFVWMFSLTYNFYFFWEDSYILGQIDLAKEHPEKFSAKSIANTFLDSFFRPEQFYSAQYGWKPIQEQFMYPFLASLFGTEVVYHRFFKAILYSLLILIYFSFMVGLSREYPHVVEKFIFLPLFLLHLLLLPEVWISVLYLADTLIFTLLCTTAALFFFYFYYRFEKSKLVLFFLFLSIVLLTQLSIVTKHVGRLNVLILFFFLFFSDRKKLFQKKYLVLLILLVCISFPILGFFRILGGESLFNILGISSHLSERSNIMPFFDFIKTLPLSFLPHAPFLLGLLCFSFIINIFCILFRRKRLSVRPELKNILVFSFFWFLFSAAALFIARGFVFDIKFFLRFEFTLFIFPQILFVLSYATFVRKKYFSKNKAGLYLIYLCMVLGVFYNVVWFNEWRGGWGEYFLGYDAARQYVDSTANNSVLLVRLDHAAPTYFVSNNTVVMVSDITNSSQVNEFRKNYSRVFITNPAPVSFSDNKIVLVANVSIKDASPYGILKKSMGRYYLTTMYVYEAKKAQTFINAGAV